MKNRCMFALMIISVIVLLCFQTFAGVAFALPGQRQTAKTSATDTIKNQENQSEQAQGAQYATPAPFMYQPYYGNAQMSSRMVSFFDHDRPWYETDNKFVRYDGYTATGSASVYNCHSGIDCYDGHDGYDYNMYYEPVLNVAAGNVTRAGWWNPADHSSAYGLYVGIDHGNTLMTIYGHLSMLNVAVGDKVGTQWQIGTSGTTGASTGPHLHLSTYYLPYWNATDPNGWQGKGADPNTVPDTMLWLSRTGSSIAVPALSSTGLAAYPGATVIDDGASGWSSTGNWTHASSSTDVNGGLHWTSTINGRATATATWQPTLHDGYYEIGVFVPDNHATSGWATYTVKSADPNNSSNQLTHTMMVDESRIGTSSWNHAQWVGLGTYYFRANQLSQVSLSNATGETGYQIAADGMEFVQVNIAAPKKYGFSFVHDGTPATMQQNSTGKIDLTLKNDSNFSWDSNGSLPTQLVYSWLDSKNKAVGQSVSIALPHGVPAGATIQMNVSVKAPNLTGSYLLQWDMKEGSSLFSQKGVKVSQFKVLLAPKKYGFSFVHDGTPAKMAANSTGKINLTMKNNSDFSWDSKGSLAIQLVYSWLDSKNKAVGQSVSIALPHGVPAGATIQMNVSVKAPNLKGNYLLQWDMKEGSSLFSQKGVKVYKFKVLLT